MSWKNFKKNIATELSVLIGYMIASKDSTEQAFRDQQYRRPTNVELCVSDTTSNSDNLESKATTPIYTIPNVSSINDSVTSSVEPSVKMFNEYSTIMDQFSSLNHYE